MGVKICFGAVVFLGLAALGRSALEVFRQPPGLGWLIIAILVIPAGRFTVKLPGSVNSKISIADTLIFTNIVLFGASVGAVTAGLDGCLGSLRVVESKRRIQFTLFNVATMTMSAYLSGKVFFLALGGGSIEGGGQLTVGRIVGPALLMALAHYLLNSTSVAAMVALDMRSRFWTVWRERFLWTSLTYFTGASAACAIAIYARAMTLASLGLMAPVFAVIYFTYRTYLERAEERAHREQLDTLYLRTVEALTVAIDAREAGTLGDARRIQFYAGGLARAMNIQDSAQIRGIEAAALLLDIGNLAVPEYILNNPGELSSGEFQKVMIHPVVGANILGNIDFPYPVTEYVRHHHEKWDGTGYPEGLAGEAIPLGARILAVADCYVALTAERPYQRPRPHQAALNVIRAKAGLAYDPEVVGKFLKIIDGMNQKLHKVEKPTVESGWSASEEIGTKMASRPTAPDLIAYKDISTTQREVAALYDLSQSLASAAGLAMTLEAGLNTTATIMRFTMGVVYLFHREEHRLVAEHVWGGNARAFENHAIELGEGVSGWAAAMKEPVLNGVARQDFGPSHHAAAVPLELALACPLMNEKQCIGTITLYSAPGERFGNEDQRILASVAQKLTPAILSALRYEEARGDAVTDALTGLPNVRHFRSTLEQALTDARSSREPLAILVMDLDGFKAVNDLHGHHSGDLVLKEAAQILRGLIRGDDLVARYGGDEFVAVLYKAKTQAAQDLAHRIRNSVDGATIEIAPGKTVHVGISVGCAAYPEDGDAIDSLIRRADVEMYADKARRVSARSKLALQAS